MCSQLELKYGTEIKESLVFHLGIIPSGLPPMVNCDSSNILNYAISLKKKG